MSDQSTSAPVIYKDVPGFPGYRVGDDGTVWSRHRNTKNTHHLDGAWHELKGGLDKDGYRKVILCNASKRRYVRVNVLVLEVFRGRPAHSFNSAHENGIRSDNRLSNLRWDTQKNNVADKRRHGTHQAGVKHGNAKFTDQQITEIRRRRAAGERGVDLAKEYGVNPATISAICVGRNWSHVAPTIEEHSPGLF